MRYQIIVNMDNVEKSTFWSRSEEEIIRVIKRLLSYEFGDIETDSSDIIEVDATLIDFTDEDELPIADFKNCNCLHCGSLLGIDCGYAEPDYNEDFCSIGCYEKGESK